MKAVILAGGLGTRLKEEVPNLPKPMAPIGTRPFLEILMNQLNQANFTEVTICISYKGEIIKEYFKDKYKDIKIIYSYEKHPLGTGGAIKQALERYKNANEDIFILNGDSFSDLDLRKMSEFHRQNHFKLTIALKEMKEFDRYGSVEVDAFNQVIKFNEKIFLKKGLINSGIYVTTPAITRYFPEQEVFSFENDFLNIFYKDITFGGYKENSFFIDIGVPEDYLKAKEYL
jgi:D-glycero-alpha-D-manno-heptose 1-phosphate guanylyltransferase